MRIHYEVSMRGPDGEYLKPGVYTVPIDAVLPRVDRNGVGVQVVLGKPASMRPTASSPVLRGDTTEDSYTDGEP